MTQILPPPHVELVPETAPFSPEQRAWLNGFFAGLVSLDGAVTALSAAQSEALMASMPAVAKAPLDDGDDGEAPWHDPALPLPERMRLAQDRPLRRRMMAAMGQQDCGQCGYNCQDYANTIFLRQEERLNLCVPGGKETARALKALYEELDQAGRQQIVARSPAGAAPAAPALERSRSRELPVEVRFVGRRRLHRPGALKETWHIDIDIGGGGLGPPGGGGLGG